MLVEKCGETGGLAELVRLLRKRSHVQAELKRLVTGIAVGIVNLEASDSRKEFVRHEYI